MTVEDAVLMKNFLARFIRDEAGVTAIEYGLIGLLIPVACIVGMTLVGTQVQAMYAAIRLRAVAAALLKNAKTAASLLTAYASLTAPIRLASAADF